MSSRNASRSVLRETPSAAPISSSESRVPGSSRPSVMWVRSTSATRPAVLARPSAVRSSPSASIHPFADGHVAQCMPLRGLTDCSTIPHCGVTPVSRPDPQPKANHMGDHLDDKATTQSPSRKPGAGAAGRGALLGAMFLMATSAIGPASSPRRPSSPPARRGVRVRHRGLDPGRRRGPAERVACHRRLRAARAGSRQQGAARVGLLPRRPRRARRRGLQHRQHRWHCPGHERDVRPGRQDRRRHLRRHRRSPSSSASAPGSRWTASSSCSAW